MALDEHDADHVAVVPGHEHGVLADEHANLRLSRDLAESDGLEHDGTPAVITDPRGLLPGLGLLGREVEDSDDAVVTKNAFNSAESCHGESGSAARRTLSTRWPLSRQMRV